MPVKRRGYVKIMEKAWTKYDKSMTPLMVLICGRLRMAFMNGELRMASYEWTFTCGYLRMVLMTVC